jgi:hypothetical protein
MPIRKFRRIEDMERPKWREPGDPRLYQTIAALWEFGRRTAGRRFPPGVYRHRSIEDLNAQTARWAAMHVRTRATTTGRGDFRQV